MDPTSHQFIMQSTWEKKKHGKERQGAVSVQARDQTLSGFKMDQLLPCLLLPSLMPWDFYFIILTQQINGEVAECKTSKGDFLVPVL